MLVQEICDVFPLRGDALRCAAPLPAGVARDWARGSCVRFLACAATLVGAGADCAPPSELPEGRTFVRCCTLCALGSRYARVVFSGLMCLSAAVVCDGCCKLMLLLSLRSRFARAVASGLAADTRAGCSSAAPCIRRGAVWGEEGLYLRTETAGCSPLQNDLCSAAELVGWRAGTGEVDWRGCCVASSARSL